MGYVHVQRNRLSANSVHDDTPKWGVEPGRERPLSDNETPDPSEEDKKPDTPPPAADLGDEVKKWKAMSRKNEDEAKSLRAKVAEFENASKSEQEKAAERASAAEKRAVDAEHRLLVLEVAADKGLNAKQANRLRGANREELEADADELVAEFGGERPRPAGRPRENLQGGGDPTEEPEERDPRKLAALVPRR
jgi:hypothetical protein